MSAKFSDSGSAAGIGDVVLRGKFTVYRGEHLGFAGGMDFRLPTGDSLNFLGSGSLGVKPFGIVSYSARVSPHAEVGFEWNGASQLAGQNLVPGANAAAIDKKGPIPNRFLYIVGADVAVVKRLTARFRSLRTALVPLARANLAAVYRSGQLLWSHERCRGGVRGIHPWHDA